MAAVQLVEGGSADWRTSPPTRYQDRAPMLELPRRKVSGIWYGPLILFSKWKHRCSVRGCRGLVAYMKVGSTWYRWDSEPESLYTREFYEEICSDPRTTRTQVYQGAWVTSYSRYCGSIKNPARLTREGGRIFTAAINSFSSGTEQAGQTVPDPYGSGAPPADPGDPEEKYGIFTGITQGGSDWKKWVVPVGFVGGALWLYQTGRIG
jgi:hypothetical protein